jgi:glycosyltransferase involved in cell wall biosynthesis
MRSLQRLGYRVDFVAEHSLAGEEAGRALAAAGITCWHAPWIASVEEVLRRMGESLDLVYLHRFGVMQRYGDLTRRWCPRAWLIYCVADLHYLRLARRLAVEASGAMVEAGAMPDVDSEEVAGLRTAELTMALAADAVLTHSSFELALLRQDVPEANVHLVPWEVAVRPTAVPFAERAGVAFVGSFGHPPNLDAALFLVEKVMPLVWERDPTIPCFLAGSDLPAVLRTTAGSAPRGRVMVLGQVPALAEVWDRARLSAAPLRFGAGLKGKVLDSLAAGIPCVCSPVAAEGTDLPREFQGLVGNSPEALAAIILRLHNDEPDNAAIAEAGLGWVREHLSAERIDAALAAAVRGQPLAPAPLAAAELFA